VLTKRHDEPLVFKQQVSMIALLARYKTEIMVSAFFQQTLKSRWVRARQKKSTWPAYFKEQTSKIVFQSHEIQQGE